MASLLSGLGATALIQVQTCVESAVLISGSVYQSLGLHKPTVLDVRHELATLTATLDQGTVALNALPHDACDESHILDIGPKGAAICGAISRTTAAIKSIPGPVSQEEGTTLLSSYKEVQAKYIAIVAAINVRMAALEQGASGLCDYGYNKVLGLFEDLYQALLRILPPSIADQAHEIHGPIAAASKDSLALLNA